MGHRFFAHRQPDHHLFACARPALLFLTHRKSDPRDQRCSADGYKLCGGIDFPSGRLKRAIEYRKLAAFVADAPCRALIVPLFGPVQSSG